MTKLVKILDAHQVLMKMADVKLPYAVARKLSKITKITTEEMTEFEKSRDEIAGRWREVEASEEERNAGYMTEINEILVADIDVEFPKLKEAELETIEFSLRDLAVIDFLIED